MLYIQYTPRREDRWVDACQRVYRHAHNDYACAGFEEEGAHFLVLVDRVANSIRIQGLSLETNDLGTPPSAKP